MIFDTTDNPKKSTTKKIKLKKIIWLSHRCFVERDRQEVAFEAKKNTKKGRMGWPWEIGGWKEKSAGEGARGKGEKEIDIESEKKWKEKKSSKLVCSTQQPAGGTKGE